MKKLFLDIEGTLIEDLNNPEILPRNIKIIQSCIAVNRFDEIETFSFGLWDKNDLIRWAVIQSQLDNQFGLKIATQRWLTDKLKLEFLNDVVGVVQPHELHDFGRLTNKTLMFEWFVKKHGKGINTAFLFDDTVENKTIITNNQKIDIFNILDC